MPEKENQNLSQEQIVQAASTAAAAAVAQALADKSANANEASLRINEKVHQLQVKQQSYAARIKSEMDQNINCTTIVIPEMFKKWQPSFTASINGCTINIPANGRPYKVHNDFAVIINRRMKHLSEKVANMSAPDISEYNRN